MALHRKYVLWIAAKLWKSEMYNRERFKRNLKSKALEKPSATKPWIGKFRSLNQVLAL